MNTPAHVLLAAAAFGSGREARILYAAVLGALAPDASLYLMAGWALWVQNIPPQVVFDELYFSPGWQTVFAIDNSFFLWAGLMLVARASGSAVLTAFSAAGLLHLALDFPLHAGDGRPHFWPASQWVFDSPVSYWDSSHHAMWVAPATVALSVLSFAVLWRRGIGMTGGIVFAVLLGMELWVARQWILFF
ncbi:MAG: cobalamin biosynthesis protein CobQ [Pseudomonadota bacterium]